jgi:hypothetical protein
LGSTQGRLEVERKEKKRKERDNECGETRDKDTSKMIEMTKYGVKEVKCMLYVRERERLT